MGEWGGLTLVTGGARCGKSTFAEDLAARRGGDEVTYIATCQPLDDEMVERVALHRKRRPPAWQTVEEPFQVANVLAKVGYKSKVVLVDCLALLVSNYLTGGCLTDKPLVENAVLVEKAWNQVEAIIQASSRIPAQTIIVSNEVGWGLVPTSSLGRAYRDLLGKANCALAAQALEVYLVVAGMPLELKSWARGACSEKKGRDLP